MSGPSVTLSATDQPVVTFVAPPVLDADSTALEFTLTVLEPELPAKTAVTGVEKPISDTAHVYVRVKKRNQSPIAVIGTNTTRGPAPLTVNFDGSGSTDPDGTISRYFWTLGDGTSATGVACSRVYPAPGTYQVKLVVTDDRQATGSATTTITVDPPPTPGVLTVSPSTGVNSTGVQGGPFTPATFDFVLTNTGGAVLSWTASKTQSWVTLSKSGGTLAAGGSDVIAVALNSTTGQLVPGTYQEVITFTDTSSGSAGLTRELSLTIIPAPVNAAPSVDAGSDQAVMIAEGCTLRGTVSDDGQPGTPGTLTTLWSVVSGPGAVSFADAGSAQTTAGFAVPGEYVLRLTASDGALSADDTVKVYVVPALTLEASPTSGTAPLTVQFTAKTGGRLVAEADLPTRNLSDLHWDFGDGTMGQGAQSSRVYGQGGTYQVTLTLVLAGAGLADIGCTALTSGNCNLAVTVTNPGTLTVEPSDNLVSSGPQGGSFTPSAKTYTLRNTGSSPIAWT
ncbi:MAG: PKD domain-containing protein, partial [Phycisphaerae bacterium]